MMYGDNLSFQYNPEKCIERIDTWLESEGLIDVFYEIDEEKDLHDYINKLWSKYSKQ